MISVGINIFLYAILYRVMNKSHMTKSLLKTVCSISVMRPGTRNVHLQCCSKNRKYCINLMVIHVRTYDYLQRKNETLFYIYIYIYRVI